MISGHLISNFQETFCCYNMLQSKTEVVKLPFKLLSTSESDFDYFSEYMGFRGISRCSTDGDI